jgi:hypothetical protein
MDGQGIHKHKTGYVVQFPTGCYYGPASFVLFTREPCNDFLIIITEPHPVVLVAIPYIYILWKETLYLIENCI